ncbi:MAG: hypothetical protein ACI976_000072 [Aureispira sp.]|jgi:hypothetical protein
MPPPKKHAVYVLRHAQDFELTEKEEEFNRNEPDPNKKIKESDFWEKPSDSSQWFSETLPGDKTFNFPWKRLNEEGKDQARIIAEYLMDVERKGSHLPIRRVVIQNPEGSNRSQNTLFTALPLIDALEEKNPGVTVNVLDSDPDFDDDSIVDIITASSCNFSTVIVLDRQHLWGYENREANKKQSLSDPPASDSIIGKVFGKLFKNFDVGWNNGRWKGIELAQNKGGLIYKFFDFNNEWNTDLTGYELDIEVIEKKGTDGTSLENRRGIKLYDRTLKKVSQSITISNYEMQE